MSPADGADLSGRTALVTGAGNGLGRATARALAAHGARVVLVGRTAATLAETAALLPDGASRVAVCDVSDPRSVERLGTELQHEVVDVLVNNAGVGGPVAALVDVDPADWDQVMASNVRSVFLVCRTFAPAMVARGRGDIICIASVAAKRPLAARTPYCASKAAVIALSTTLAAELGPLGVTVNCLSPGPVRSARMARNFALEAARTGSTVEVAERAYTSRGMLGRLLEEDEVAGAVLAMLAMPGLHGADIDLSAGMVAR